jgi:hypothetical protein
LSTTGEKQLNRVCTLNIHPNISSSENEIINEPLLKPRCLDFQYIFLNFFYNPSPPVMVQAIINRNNNCNMELIKRAKKVHQVQHVRDTGSNGTKMQCGTVDKHSQC